MTYVEGFLTPVPTARRDDYLAHARRAAPVLLEIGAARMVECWGDDVPHGTRTDFYRAVAAEDGEAVVFSWFEHADKGAREAANTRLMDDPRMAELSADMPFDAARMIYGGFEAVSVAGAGGPVGYIDGVVLPVRADARDTYATHARDFAALFLDVGASRVVDTLADDVNPGERTDFLRAVAAEADEIVAFGWVEWPDKATRDAGWAKAMEDPRMRDAAPPPWDGKRMIFGGFAVILDTATT